MTSKPVPTITVEIEPQPWPTRVRLKTEEILRSEPVAWLACIAFPFALLALFVLIASL